MGYGTGMASILLMMLSTKENGLRERSMVEERLFLQVEVFFRDHSKTI